MSDQLYRFKKIVRTFYETNNYFVVDNYFAVFERPAIRGLAKLLGLKETVRLSPHHLNQLNGMRVFGYKGKVMKLETSQLPEVRKAYAPKEIEIATTKLAEAIQWKQAKDFRQQFGVT